MQPTVILALFALSFSSAWAFESEPKKTVFCASDGTLGDYLTNWREANRMNLLKLAVDTEDYRAYFKIARFSTEQACNANHAAVTRALSRLSYQDLLNSHFKCRTEDGQKFQIYRDNLGTESPVVTIVEHSDDLRRNKCEEMAFHLNDIKRIAYEDRL